MLIYTEINGNPYIEKQHKPKEITDIMEFPSDVKRVVKEFSTDEVLKMAKAWGMN